ncbi:spermatogenesis-associated serine-rich protein 2 [Heteronotia binoei]|uniref:spermatogenesis-associated serine-rich protein 2 n=1 Tax=Heteronotia binoei TaxID=13085 RepID=UPI00292F4C6D|nr:spermatogenesis-associated serine-rich protein 2 [Heteronotia binoei]XP_060109443.1 spermatogenesis-associated serine-rich protein 2 [Heteronotia binoei]
MSKKQNQKDSSGFIFDVQSNTVMAQGGTFENMKEKISAVRAIVPNRSNNEIILVLQHFDNCVDRTVQAFMEGSASAVLKEWTVTGKKKNKKKKTKPKPPAESSASLLDPSKPVSTEEEQSAASSEKGGINGYHVNGTTNDTESVDSLSEGLDTLSIDARELEESEPATPEVPDRAATLELESRLADFSPKSAQNAQSFRAHPELRSPSKPFARPAPSTQSAVPSSLAMLDEVPVSSGNKKLGSNIEKSVKDLQRCTVSLARYRVVVKEEMDASIKKMKQAFAELQSCLMDREVALLGEMDKVKAEAMEILSSRQKKAEALKKLTDVAVRMSEEQLVELRADIKHFVSERKYDEDLGRVARFTCDLDGLKKTIDTFGHVSHPKNSYSTRSRCSSVTSVSVSSPNESTTTESASASASSLTTANKKQSAPTETPGNVANRPYQPYREGFQGNRRPGQGYRPQGQRQNGALHPNSNRYRNGPWYQSGSRSRPPPGNTNNLSQTYPMGTNGTGTGPGPEAGPPAPTAQAHLGTLNKEAKALPQRKPRSSQYEVPSS